MRTQATKTPRQLAAEYRKAQEAEYSAQTREQVEEAHALCAAIWQEAQRRKGKEAKQFRRMIEGKAHR